MRRTISIVLNAADPLLLVGLLLLAAHADACFLPLCRVEPSRLPKNVELLKMDGYAHVLLVPDDSTRDQLVALIEALSCQDPVVSELGISRAHYSSLLVRVFRKRDRDIASRSFSRSRLRGDREYSERIVAEYVLHVEGTEYGMLGSAVLADREVVLKRGPMVDELLESLKREDWSPRSDRDK